jgi:hypothetical protein
MMRNKLNLREKSEVLMSTVYQDRSLLECDTVHFRGRVQTFGEDLQSPASNWKMKVPSSSETWYTNLHGVATQKRVNLS